MDSNVAKDELLEQNADACPLSDLHENSYAGRSS
jgi:hypothetical protein